jgi:hypothetical protein
MIAWEKDFHGDGSVEGGQPPNKLNHNMYLDQNNTDLTFATRSPCALRRGGPGAIRRLHRRQRVPRQQRGLRISSAGCSDTGYPVGNYSLTCRQPGHLGGLQICAGQWRGAWGMANWRATSVPSSTTSSPIGPIQTIPAEIAAKFGGKFHSIFTHPSTTTPSSGTGLKNQNVDGLDTNVLNQTTIQLFTGAASQQAGRHDRRPRECYLRAQAGGASTTWSTRISSSASSSRASASRRTSAQTPA